MSDAPTTAAPVLEDLLDGSGVVELGPGPAGAAVRAVCGTVEGRDVVAVSCAAPPAEADRERLSRAFSLAAGAGRPVVVLHGPAGETGPAGSRAAGGLRGLGAHGRLLREGARLSGVVPHIALVTGPVAAGQELLVRLADVVVATGEGEPRGDLPGGAADLVAQNPADACDLVRELLSVLPANNLGLPPRLPPGAPGGDPGNLVPQHPSAGYDVREVIARLADDTGFLELHAGRSPGVVTGFARLDGRATGVVATVPAAAGGRLDAAGADQAAWLVRTCDAFGVPVLTLVDTPGFVPAGPPAPAGVQERAAATRLLHAYAAASVPLLTVLTGRAHGEAYLLLGSRHVGADLVLAWPRARIAALDPLAAVADLHGPDLRLAAGQGDTGHEDAEEAWLDRVAESDAAASPSAAVATGDVDAVVAPGDTRDHLARALRLLQHKQAPPPARKHGNLPL